MSTTLDAQIRSVKVFPLIKYYMNELNLFELFKKYVPKGKAELEPAEGLCLMIVNILDSNRPLYKVEEWLADYADGKGEAILKASKYNDDRLGRCCIDGLYRADRQSLMTEVSANAIRVHELETKCIHNDTTTVTLQGAYNSPTGAVKPVKGYNKDFRPDCKQIVFGLNVTADGHVPISYNALDGNTSDSETHIPNWEQLRSELGSVEFTYVAESKLCSIENLKSIAGKGGKFITVMPATRQEVKDFHNQMAREKILWQPAYQKENSRKRGDFTTYRVYEAISREGYRIVWVHSSTKEQNDACRRSQQIIQAEKNLRTLSSKLNRYQLKTRESIQSAVQTAIEGVSDYLNYEITEQTTTELKQIGRGKPNAKTQYLEKTCTTYELSFSRHEKAIAKAAATDGVFPLVDNTDKSAVDVLKTYKQQPSLEKRHSTLKSVTGVSPIYFKKPERIEAMLFLYFMALMIISLVERNIRRNLSEELDKGQLAKVETGTQLPPGTKKPSKAQKQTPSDLKAEEVVSEWAPLSKVIEPIESQTTRGTKTEELEAFIPDKPINLTPVDSTPLAVPFKQPEITEPSVLIEASTHSVPNVTSVPRFKPLKPNLPEIPIMGLPILPQGMKTKTPTWENLKYFFRNVYQVVITEGTQVWGTLLKGMRPMHYKILELLGVPSSSYDHLIDDWWRFQAL